MEARPTPPADAAPPDEGASGALDALYSLLIPGESVETYAIQRRLFALSHRRVIVAATSGRLIAVARGLISGFTVQDLRWQDLRDAQLQVGIVAATLAVSAHASTDLGMAESAPRQLRFTGLRKRQAQEVYRTCQAQEQAWREKRRVRELEELRARSGGVHLGTAPGGIAAAGAGEAGTPEARLQRASSMRQQGLLTDAEFEQIKARILADL